ncbi:S-adenosyl-L-methionine-dependent methyltransferase [Jaminaea rosea]|uniref:S-adenosyl-L-methionine-dependent methyltransferase n=1 Tax=Jaminaea rosea TaxID=1569628 RepID=A0A316USP9_9BASI|nr:S-adenosyl-L-methionine-dependent methyltransferase [Jaminaea rosea]PWN28326.1 S-adenosyl-L-methionine-dependent methyltransferase [Jaminaea rosea]
MSLMEDWLTFLSGLLVGLCAVPLLPFVMGLLKRFAGGQGGNEAYADLDVQVLNTLPPKTEWMNMGWWTGDDEGADPFDQCDKVRPLAETRPLKSLPEACEALALKLYSACGLTEGAAILDIGHGPGESVLLLKSRFQPQRLDGATLSLRDAQRAQGKLASAAKGGEGGTEVQIKAADGAAFLKECNPATYDYIFALDCAYHFSSHSRKDFFTAAHRALKPGGKLGLFDMFLATPYPAKKKEAKGSRGEEWFKATSAELPCPTRAALTWPQELKLRLFCLLTSTPRRNLLPFSSYFSTLCSAGFSSQDISIMDVSSHVFPGFARFLRDFAEGDEWRAGAGGWNMRKALGSFAGFVEGWARGGDEGLLRGGLVVVTKAKQL